MTPNPIAPQWFQTASPHFLARYERRWLLKVFWIIAILTLLFLLVQDAQFLSILGAGLIAFTALLPSYFWCSGRALGLPIFPLFALTYLWTHAFPLVSGHLRVMEYTAMDHFIAGVTVAGFLGLGTLVWLQFVISVPKPPKSYRALAGNQGDNLFFGVLIASVLFQVNSFGGWFPLDSGTSSLVRGVVLGLNVLATFILAYRIGTKELQGAKATVVTCLIAAYAMTSAVGLLLVVGLSTFLISTVGFILGRQKVPWRVIILVFLCASLLHLGKAEMRSKYWGGYQRNLIQPWNYPAWYAEWVGYSLDKLTFSQAPGESTGGLNVQGQPSLLDRSSVIHLLLMVQSRLSTESIPYLYGETYEIIPQLLVPRILNSNKIRSHEGTYLLNIHYGLQTREATATTTIGWGLVNEAYANFGLIGCAGLAIVLGSAYGLATRWCMHTPILSARSLFAILLISTAFRSEWTAGVSLSVLFQSAAPLGILTVVLMRSYYLQNPSVTSSKMTQSM